MDDRAVVCATWHPWEIRLVYLPNTIHTLVPKHRLKHPSSSLRHGPSIDAMFGVLRRRCCPDRSAREVKFDVALSRVSYVGATKQ